MDGSDILSYWNHPAAIADLSNWEADNRNCPSQGTIVHRDWKSGKGWLLRAVLPHRLNYSSPTSPMALNDVMGSAVQRDERDKAEPLALAASSSQCTARLGTQQAAGGPAAQPSSGEQPVLPPWKKGRGNNVIHVKQKNLWTKRREGDYLLKVNFLDIPAYI